jgi:hypothetical protein
MAYTRRAKGKTRHEPAKSAKTTTTTIPRGGSTKAHSSRACSQATTNARAAHNSVVSVAVVSKHPAACLARANNKATDVPRNNNYNSSITKQHHDSGSK